MAIDKHILDRHSLITRRNRRTFEYTDLDQLKTLSGPGQFQNWDTDSVGNWQWFLRAGANPLIQHRHHGPDNRLLGIGTQASWVSPAYDRNGNTTHLPKPPDPSKSLTATYDAWNRLVEVKDGPTTYRYDYDALGRRIEKHRRVGGQVQESRRFVYSTAWQVLEESLKSAATGGAYQRACEYVWGLRGLDDLILRDRFDVAGSGGERLYPSFPATSSSWKPFSSSLSSGGVSDSVKGRSGCSSRSNSSNMASSPRQCREQEKAFPPLISAPLAAKISGESTRALLISRPSLSSFWGSLQSNAR